MGRKSQYSSNSKKNAWILISKRSFFTYSFEAEAFESAIVSDDSITFTGKITCSLYYLNKSMEL
ncbi:hypothetical protein [Halobacillus campisalis]|uniref:Uncharacterized protein n=1 Tax=Halobacillus campisalis TaxID=435909 RepID=A0ABW2K448_9BACI|nr:hypothetical protein [Halobacillus campisalis]